jgi:hypothetical protein
MQENQEREKQSFNPSSETRSLPMSSTGTQHYHHHSMTMYLPLLNEMGKMLAVKSQPSHESMVTVIRIQSLRCWQYQWWRWERQKQKQKQ